MTNFLLFFLMLFPLRFTLASESPVPESALDGLSAEVIAGLSDTVLTDDLISMYPLETNSGARFILETIEITQNDRKRVIHHRKKYRAKLETESEALLPKIGFE